MMGKSTLSVLLLDQGQELFDFGDLLRLEMISIATWRTKRWMDREETDVWSLGNEAYHLIGHLDQGVDEVFDPSTRA